MNKLKELEQKITSYEDEAIKRLNDILLHQLQSEIIKYSKELYLKLTQMGVFGNWDDIAKALNTDDFYYLLNKTLCSLNLGAGTEFLLLWNTDCINMLKTKDEQLELSLNFSLTKHLTILPDKDNTLSLLINKKENIKAIALNSIIKQNKYFWENILTTDARSGNCHPLSLSLAYDMEANILTGFINLPYKYLLHSVVEFNNYILDPTLNLMFKKEDYLKLFNFEIVSVIENVDEGTLILDNQLKDYYLASYVALETLAINNDKLPEPKILKK